MDTERLNKWAELLLDTGKGNNLINFKDSKASTVEIVLPDPTMLINKAERGAAFEFFDPDLDSEDDEDEEGQEKKAFDKEDYVDAYGEKLKKNQVLAYNIIDKPVRAVKNIEKRNRSAIEETGVNIAYIAVGFIHWTESDNSQITMSAPVLLAPVSIEAGSSVEPCKLRIIDDDILINPTFSYKLQAEYGIKLPEYDEDTDVDVYLRSVEEVVSKLGWSVSGEAKIGIFSFQKINMYKDLKNNVQIISDSENVRALFGETPETEADDGGEASDKPVVLHNVVDADSSQAEAVEMAKRGASFVLQGPPGTGKSQTITNIVAELMSDGKTVLFVSEKLAALNVVYGKLKDAGLGEFCLELHSHKANKKQVIDELCDTLRAQRFGLSDRAEREFKARLDAENRLNDYERELHAVRPVIGKSLYKLLGEVSACRDAEDVEFVIENISEKGESYFETALNLLNRYALYTESVGYDYRDNVWHGYVSADRSFESVMGLKRDIESAADSVDKLIAINSDVTAELSVGADSINDAELLNKLFGLIKDSEFVTPALFDGKAAEKAAATVAELRGLAEVILDCKAKLDAEFDKDIYKLDGVTAHKKLVRQFGGFFARLFSGEYRRILSELKLSRKNGRKLKYSEAVAFTEISARYIETSERFEERSKTVSEKLGSGYIGVGTDFTALSSELDTLRGLLDKKSDLTAFNRLSQKEFDEKRDAFKRFDGRYSAAFIDGGAPLKRLGDRFDPKEYDLFAAPLGEFEGKLAAMSENTDKLDNWCEFVALLHKLEEHGLRGFVDFTINSRIAAKRIARIYEKAFCAQWAHYLTSGSPVLRELTRVPHDELIKNFREKDTLCFTVNKAKIRAELAAKRPTLDMIAQGSAVAVLLREGEKKRKKKGIRQLIGELTELVQTLKPCFLMSPLSVSTYLSPEMKFDAVIFDEASQIFPQDAVGAVYRGRQLIVVGDSKQMPPSNFFNADMTGDMPDELGDDFADFESILDLCSASLPQKRLLWHYRSRFEQLIAFSNKNFYGNTLITFPSAKSDGEGAGVNYVHVDGVFDRTSRTNRIEAERIVDLVFEHFDKYPNRSLGVVAFGISQQNLIDRLIDRRRRNNRAYEEFFKPDRPEPFFVKNLETVQGDERDRIIFSVAYGKDEDGRLLLNFGPVNREGGERRLNVAFTRAKFNVCIVSSMRCTDIDVSRSKSVGVRLLREYLDYAENGSIALSRTLEVKSADEFDSDFETEVCDFLRGKGFCVDSQVGCSSFKIDLAVKRPQSSDYVLAVECDGAMYHSSKSARDRDRLRQEVLERMGWRFYRIWSTDWFKNKAVEKERLVAAAKAALDSAPLPSKSAPLLPESFGEEVDESPFEFPEYNRADERKLAKDYNGNALEVIKAIVAAESPVSEEWLIKRIAFMFGREKVTSAVRDEYNRLSPRILRSGIAIENGFLYAPNTDIPVMRVPKTGDVPREIGYIELTELSKGLDEILKRNVTVQKSGLFKLVAAKLGFSRAGDAITERLELALQLIENDITVNGEMLSAK